jgi:hypothetical protein
MGQRFRQALREHGHALPSLAVVVLTFFWFVTWGTGRLFDSDPDCNYVDRYYEAQAASLLQGRFDVELDDVQIEAFVHDGKYYGYFGLLPAVMRLPLVSAFPGILWGPPLMLVACALNMLCAYWLIRTVGRLLTAGRPPSRLQKFGEALFLIVVGLGSTNIFLAGRAFVHNEAASWGTTFALLFYCCFIKYLLEPRSRYLLIGGAFALLSFHARALPGAGALLCLSLFVGLTLLAALRAVWRPAAPKAGPDGADPFGIPRGAVSVRHWLIAVAAIGVTVGLYFAVNYVRFGTVSGLPMDRYCYWNPAIATKYGCNPTLYEKFGGKTFLLENLRTGLYNYASPAAVEISVRFPFLSLTTSGTQFPEARINLFMPYSSFTATNPALLLLTLVGVVRVFRARSPVKALRLPVLAALASGGLIVCCTSLTERYKHDCFAFLVMTAAVGLGAILALNPGRPRSRWLAVIVVLTLFSVSANLACTLVYQRDTFPSYGYTNKWSAEKGAELDEVRRQVDPYVRKLIRAIRG